MKNLTRQNPRQLIVAQELINKVKSKCCGIKEIEDAGHVFVRGAKEKGDINNTNALNEAYELGKSL